jgi:hypothetical protein
MPEPTGFEKYGIKLRKNALNNGVLISSLMPLGPFDGPDQALIMVWALAAPLAAIYGAKYRALKLHKEGKQEDATAALMCAVHEWYDSAGIPQDATQEVLDAAGETFAMASRLMPKVTEAAPEAGGGLTIKKNGDLGSSSASTS